MRSASGRRRNVTHRIAGIDVHKRMLAVVIADVAVEGEYQFERRKVGTSPTELCRLADWLVAQQVEEVVMESTAQYWRPVWATLGQRWRPKRLQESGGARSTFDTNSPKTAARANV
jgi:hypothetical protein